MRKRFRITRSRRLASVQFCDGCGTVCDAASRSRAIRDGARDRALAFGGVR